MYAAYFNEIFQSSKTVIIPGLGSFTKLSETNINFNPYLKFNDGYLAGFIAKKQGVTIDEAGKNIADSVAKIQDALTQKGEAMVLGLGVLKKAADGKISFTAGGADESKAPVTEVKKEEVKPVVTPPKVEVKPVVTEVKEKVVEAIKPVEIKKPEIPPVKVDVKVNAPKLTEAVELDKKGKEELAKKLKLEKEEEAKKAKLASEEAAKKLKLAKEEEAKKIKLAKEAESKKSKSEKEEDAKKLKLAKEEEAKKAKQIKLEKEAEAKKAKDEAARIAKEKKDAAKLAKAQARGERKKRKFPVWLMIVLVLVVGGGTFAAVKWDMVKGWLGMDKAKTEEPKKDIAKVEEGKEEAVVDSTMVDTAAAVDESVVEDVKTEPVKEEKTVPVKVVPVRNVTNGNFHVITGNFQSQTLADGMVAKLNAEGNQAVNLGNRGGFFMVSAGSFSSLEEANAKRQAISTAHPKAYIYNGQ